MFWKVRLKIMINIKLREGIEWLNYWIENAQEEKKNRILILGDSVARGYRPVFNRIAQKKDFAVDLLAMSYSIFDPLLLKEILHFMGNIGYEYFYIIFNLGAHHGYALQVKNNEALQELYFQKLDEILCPLSRMTNNIITLSGTPERIGDSNANNDEIRCRNKILESISKQYGYKYLDVYSQLCDNDKFPLIDLFHYMDNGYEYIANVLGKELGFLTKNISANRISSLKALTEILKNGKRKYIYGDGKRGEQLYKYLCNLNVEIEEKFIVSDEFYKKGNRFQIALDEIKGRVDGDDIILVTPENIALWENLDHLKLNYYTLSAEIYEFIYEYVAAYIDL